MFCTMVHRMSGGIEVLFYSSNPREQFEERMAKEWNGPKPIDKWYLFEGTPDAPEGTVVNCCVRMSKKMFSKSGQDKMRKAGIVFSEDVKN